jgi:hypothetical protein
LRSSEPELAEWGSGIPNPVEDNQFLGREKPYGDELPFEDIDTGVGIMTPLVDSVA